MYVLKLFLWFMMISNNKNDVGLFKSKSKPFFCGIQVDILRRFCNSSVETEV